MIIIFVYIYSKKQVPIRLISISTLRDFSLRCHSPCNLYLWT